MSNLLAETKKLCKRYNIRPARSKGQNFLIWEKVYDQIVASADLKKSDTVLEVGPGLGFLTEKLSRQAKQVIAVELDDRLAKALSERLEEQKIKNVEVVNEDILKTDIVVLLHCSIVMQRAGRSYKIVANLPYNITSRFLRKFLSEVECKPALLVLLLQKEVAERLTAKPGEMSLLAVSAQFYADVKMSARVPKEAFWPMPKVESSVVKLEVRSGKLESNEDEEGFFKLVKAGFSAKRKQLQGNLSKQLKINSEKIKEILQEAGLSERVRAQELSVDEWKKLYVVLHRQNML
jgi:16S rRNA (adenine1518-N6/adenine1519-N6)-dimethyltransferase